MFGIEVGRASVMRSSLANIKERRTMSLLAGCRLNVEAARRMKAANNPV